MPATVPSWVTGLDVYNMLKMLYRMLKMLKKYDIECDTYKKCIMISNVTLLYNMLKTHN